jgi:hypothetical protein
MNGFNASGGHSADVRITLHINGRKLRVAKVAPDRLYLDEPQPLAQTDGELVISIDGQLSRRRVVLDPSAIPDRVVPVRFESEA